MDNIPKILHLYWDRSPMAWLQTLTVTTFHKLNPDWEINVYLPKQNYFGKAKYIPDYTGKDYFYLLEELDYIKIISIDVQKYGIDSDIHNILRSDIFRYNVLYDIGGVWSDFDVIWLRPIVDINSCKSVGLVPTREMGASVCRYKTIEDFHNIGILISRKGHPMYEFLIDQTTSIQGKNQNRDFLTHQAFGVEMLNSLWPSLNDTIAQFTDVVGIPYSVFYPYSVLNLGQLYVETDLSVISKNTLCVHWFNGHILSKNYINDPNFMQRCCSMTELLKELGEEVPA